MAKADKSTPTVPTEVTDNPSKIEWPYDPYGFTAKLRTEIKRAAGRVNGQDEKARILDATLKVGLGHNKSRYVKRKAALQKRLSEVIGNDDASES
jgi:hypothetical protein